MAGIKGLEISLVRMRARPATGVRPFQRGTLKWFENNIVRGKVWEVLFKNPIPDFSFQALMCLCGPSCCFRTVSPASVTLSGPSCKCLMGLSLD